MTISASQELHGIIILQTFPEVQIVKQLSSASVQRVAASREAL